MNSFLLVLHITGGCIAIASGFLAVLPRKGSRWHILFGKIFFYSMLCMAGAAAYLALFSSFERINFVIGLFTLYLVLTSRWTAANTDGRVTIKDKLGGLLGILIFFGFLILSYQAAMSGKSVIDGVYVEAFYVYTILSLLAVILDLKVIVKKGVFGAQKVARHLWRMVLALFIACGSLFLGQPQVFPESIRNSGTLNIPVLLVILVLLYWLFRVYIGSRFRSKSSV